MATGCFGDEEKHALVVMLTKQGRVKD